jgi:CDGSH-type Zn-finger protein
MTDPSNPPQPDGVTVSVKPGGPHLVRGPVIVTDREGNVITPPPAKTPGTVKLCACGRTKNFPFCDSSHKELA